MNLQGVLPVLEVILPLQNLRGQLLWLADGYKAGVQPVSEGRAEDEAARFDAQHQVDVVVDVALGQGIDQASKAQLVLQQRCDVIEKNAGLGKIGNFADELLEVVAVLRRLSLHELPDSFDTK